jgi:hypothetical protein
MGRVGMVELRIRTYRAHDCSDKSVRKQGKSCWSSRVEQSANGSERESRGGAFMYLSSSRAGPAFAHAYPGASLGCSQPSPLETCILAVCILLPTKHGPVLCKIQLQHAEDAAWKLKCLILIQSGRWLSPNLTRCTSCVICITFSH